MIHIISGVYGHYIDGKVVRKDSSSEPFELPAEDEERLVSIGVAEYVSVDPIGFDETPPEIPDGVEVVHEYSIENTAKELREIGKRCGLNFRVGMTKAEMVEALDAHIEANMVDDVDLDDIMGEPAPSFDATEAVTR